MWEALVLGLSLGLAAGVSPGPLLTLVLTATLERGFPAGLKVASAPLWSDAPVIAVSLWLVSNLSPLFLGGLGLVGGAFVIYLGFECWWKAKQSRQAAATDAAPSRDLLRGALVNLLSPSPWIFWLSVGGPLTVSLWRRSVLAGLAFVVAFYLLLVGSKVVLAALVARSRHRLDGAGYRLVLRVCGVLMLGLGLFLGYDGWQALEGLGDGQPGVGS